MNDIERGVVLAGESAVELHDMGDECLVLCATNDAGEVEKIALEWGQLLQAVEALRPRYGTAAKNTEPAVMAMAG